MKPPTAVGVGDGRKYKSIGGQFGELHERSLGIGDGSGPVTNTLHLGPRICMHGGSMLHQNGEYNGFEFGLRRFLSYWTRMDAGIGQNDSRRHMHNHSKAYM